MVLHKIPIPTLVVQTPLVVSFFFGKKCNFQNNARGGFGFANRGRGRGGHFNGQFGGRGFWSQNKPQRQLCGKIGHVGMNYYYHFDKSFLGPSQF